MTDDPRIGGIVTDNIKRQHYHAVEIIPSGATWVTGWELLHTLGRKPDGFLEPITTYDLIDIYMNGEYVLTIDKPLDEPMRIFMRGGSLTSGAKGDIHIWKDQDD